MKEILIDYVDDLLDRYTQDETGKESRQQYLDMDDNDKLQLICNELYHQFSKERDINDIMDDLDTDLVISFGYYNY